MAWYTSHTLSYRGRSVEVTARYGSPQSAMVAKGKPLDFGRSANLDDAWEALSPDAKRLVELFRSSREIRREISNFLSALEKDDD